MDSFTVNTSVKEIVDEYDGFILDQFGVLHNGSEALEGAIDCVNQLVQRKKKLIILSNSSSASDKTIQKLEKLGFDPKVLVDAVTSGEEASHYVKQSFAGKKALVWTWKDTSSAAAFLEKCGSECTDKVEEADFFLLQGVDAQMTSTSSLSLGDFFQTGIMSSTMESILEQASQRKLPMVCANPDFIMVKPDGSTGHMPGKIAQRYQEHYGGPCTSFGKPHVPHFEACVQKLNLPKERIIHVGDSLHHDVAGANATGIPSLFVMGGIHREQVMDTYNATVDATTADALLQQPSDLQNVFTQYDQIPTHVLPLFHF